MNRASAFIYFVVVIVLLLLPVVSQSVLAEQAPPVEDIEYIVIKGDTLSGIAKRFGVTVEDLYEANGLKSDLILVGQKLIIPGASRAPAITKPPFPPEKPTVKIEEPPVLPEKPAVPPGGIEFKWALVARIDPDVRDRVVNIAKVALKKDFKASVSAGDEIAAYVEPGENSYVYLYLDSRKNLELIFPTSMNKETLENEFTHGRATYIPGKNEWFTFDENKGTETFYLLASKNRLIGLEELTRQYIAAREEEKNLAKQKVLGEMMNIRTNISTNVVERPIPFIGTIRGTEIDIAKLAVEVKAENFYSRTIRLKHK